MTPAELREQLEATLAEMMLRPGPDKTVEVTPRWSRVTSRARHAMLNTVLRARLRPDEVAGAVAEMVAHYGARELPFIWLVDRASEPPDLGQRLLALGFAVGEELVYLAAPIATALDTLPPQPEIAVAEVTEANFPAFAAATRAMGVPWTEDPWAHFSRRRTAGVRAFLALADGAAVAFAEQRVERGLLLLSGAATLPAARGRGAYKSLLAHRLRLGLASGLDWAAIHCSPFSAPIAARHGFTEYGRSITYVWDPYDTGTARHR